MAKTDWDAWFDVLRKRIEGRHFTAADALELGVILEDIDTMMGTAPKIEDTLFRGILDEAAGLGPMVTELILKEAQSRGFETIEEAVKDFQVKPVPVPVAEPFKLDDLGIPKP